MTILTDFRTAVMQYTKHDVDEEVELEDESAILQRSELCLEQITSIRPIPANLCECQFRICQIYAARIYDVEDVDSFLDVRFDRNCLL